jgi:hypothetical protein
MAISSRRCPVLHARVTLVTNLEDRVTTIICTEYEGATGSCRFKQAAHEAGPLGQLLERVSEDMPEARSTRCVFRSM